MNTTERVRAPATNAMLDIEAELEFWQSCYPYRQIYHHRRPFEDYVPTLKFGYDAFLRYHRDGLSAALPVLRERYSTVPERAQIEWKDAAKVISAAWRRMEGSGGLDS